MTPLGGGMSALRVDLRSAFRQLRRTPGLTAAAVVSLALGIGANAALYQVADRALFHPLPVPQPERLVTLVDGVPADGRLDETSYRELLAYREGNRVFEGLSGSFQLAAGLSGGASGRRVGVAMVTADFFRTLGVAPRIGRGFAEADDVEGSTGVAVISHSLWQREFGRRPDIVGVTIRLNERAFTVVGVAPPGFFGLSLAAPSDVWVPLSAINRVASGFFERLDWLSTADDNLRWLRVTGRLAPGVTAEQAEANLTAIRRALPQVREPPEAEPIVSLVPTVSTLVGPDAELGTFVWLLLLVVGVTLLIACANVATILLTRGLARQREMAVRIAIGASRGRLVRQLITESALLVLLGGAAALLVANWTGDLLGPFSLPGGVDMSLVGAGAGTRLVVLSLALALIVSPLIGLAPALSAWRADPGPALGAVSTRSTAGHARARTWLVAGQFALAMMLLASSGLFIRSLRAALSHDLGFEPAGLGFVSFNLGEQRYEEEAARAFYRDLLRDSRAGPEIVDAAVASGLPLEPFGMRQSMYDGDTRVQLFPERDGIDFSVVSDGYFRTLGMALASGREFTEGDAEGAPEVVIVNETFARRVWPGERAVGKRLSFGESGPSLEVVGVARDGKYRSISEASRPFFYMPLRQRFSLAGTAHANLVFRARSDVDRAIGAALGAVAALDPDLPAYRSSSFEDHLKRVLMPQRLGSTLFGILSVVGLTLALVGVYGVVAFTVARRRRELGIRLALGATRAQIAGLVAGRGAVPVVAGIAVGTALAVLAGQLGRRFLFGISSSDPVSLAAAAAVLAACSLAAMVVPVARAVRVDPAVSLRDE